MVAGLKLLPAFFITDGNSKIFLIICFSLSFIIKDSFKWLDNSPPSLKEIES